jgi:hypothetical protein
VGLEDDKWSFQDRVEELLRNRYNFAATDKREQARRELAELGKLRTEEMANVLATVLEDEGSPDPEFRYSAAELLVAFVPERAQQLLLSHLESSDDTLRSTVANLLGLCGNHEATEPLVRTLLHDPDVTVRIHAADSLGEIGDPRAIEALQWVNQYDHEQDWETRTPSHAAAQAIERLRERQAGAARQVRTQFLVVLDFYHLPDSMSWETFRALSHKDRFRNHYLGALTELQFEAVACVFQHAETAWNALYVSEDTRLYRAQVRFILETSQQCQEILAEADEPLFRDLVRMLEQAVAKGEGIAIIWG